MWSEGGWRALVGGLWLEGGHVVPFFLAAPVRFRVEGLGSEGLGFGSQGFEVEA